MNLDEKATLAQKYFKERQYEKALPLFEELAGHAEHARALSNLGYCYQFAGRYQDAITAWTNPALNPKPDHVYKALAYNYGQLHDWPNMKANALIALEREVDDDYCWQQLAVAEYYLSDYHAAVIAAQTGLDHSPGNAYLRYYAALSHVRLGQTPNAAKHLLALLWTSPEFLDQGDEHESALLRRAVPEIIAALPLLISLKTGSEFDVAPITESKIGDHLWLHLAAEADHVQAINGLVAKGFAVDEKNELERTALMIAVKYKNVASVHNLLALGADPYLKDTYGRSAYWKALVLLPPEVRLAMLKSKKETTQLFLHSDLRPYASSILATAKNALLIEAFDTPVTLVNTFFCETVVDDSPRCETCHEPYQLLWQVDFSEFDRNDFYREGIWRIYSHFRCEEEYLADRFKYRWYTGDDITLLNKMQKPVNCKYGHATTILSVPSAHAQNCAIKEITNEFAKTESRTRLWAAYNFIEDFYIERPLISRIGGHAPWIQYEEEPPICKRCGKTKAFIAALGSDDTDIFFGDSGYFYFFACHEHADALADCSVIHQCY